MLGVAALEVSHGVPRGLDVVEHALQLAGELVPALRLELYQQAVLRIIRHLHVAQQQSVRACGWLRDVPSAFYVPIETYKHINV